MIDLHVHSTRSDGTCTPKELVDMAVSMNLRAFALTDHDSVDGISEAVAYADSLRLHNTDVPEIIPGIEFSTDVTFDSTGHLSDACFSMDNSDTTSASHHSDVHIVGLYIDYANPDFTKYLDDFVKSRDIRNEKMCRKMSADGLHISMSEMYEAFPDSVITRAHFANMLIKKGYVKSKDEAFVRYVGDHSPYYIPRERITPRRAIELILKAGGVPVLAHPMLYKMGHNTLEALVAGLKQYGLMGIEALYSTYSPSDERYVRELANKYHLLLSGGSDFHGANKPDISLGTGRGRLYIGDDILDKIKSSRKCALFVDMDGTLLKSDCTISNELKNAIDKMVEKGHRFVLNSGRPISSIIERCKSLHLEYPGTFIAANNGGTIYDWDNDVVISETTIEPNLCARIIELANRSNVHVQGFDNESVVSYTDDEEVKFYRIKTIVPLITTDDMIGYFSNRGSVKFHYISLTDHDKLEHLRDELLNTLGDKLDAFFSNPYYLEIMPKGTNKGTAVTFLEQYLPILHQNTYAAGDEENDISMLEAAQHGIAMQNATAITKSHADIVTAYDNNNDGLLEIIQQITNAK